MKTIHQYYVYILASKIRGTLYIGMTNDLQTRVYQHKTGEIKGFTQWYGINKLVYFEMFQNVNEAIDREKNMKKWKRAFAGMTNNNFKLKKYEIITLQDSISNNFSV